jgi:hypothetical protein
MKQQTIPTPDDATDTQLEEHLEGRAIKYSPDKVCSRCESKNRLRRKYLDIARGDLPDRTFEEGERIRFIAVYQDPPFLPGLEWSVHGLFHSEHPQKPREKMAVKGTAQAMGTGTLAPAAEASFVKRSTEDDHGSPDELVLTEVDIEFYSPPHEGEDKTPTETDETIIAEGIGDRPDWPEEENEWRKELITKYGRGNWGVGS